MIFCRYICATRDIKPGEVILEELPVNLSPGLSTKPVCLGCYKYVDGSHPCSKCGWPMCSKSCPFADGHRDECRFYLSQGVKVDAKTFCYDKPEPLYDVITPLRVFLSRESNPDAHRIFLELESHLEKWKQVENWVENHRYIVQYLQKRIDVTEEEILTVFGICYTNDFSVKVDGGNDPQVKEKTRKLYLYV